MVETYKYKSKIATAAAFIATIIVCLGKDGLTQIMPTEYAYIIPAIIGIAGWILAQKTENKRVDIAEQMVLEKIAKESQIEEVDPAGEYTTIPTGDATDEC